MEGTSVYPALAVAYRMQRRNGGIVIRVGLTWVYYWGVPLGASIGGAF